MFHISAHAKYTHLKNGCNILTFQNIYAMYKSKYRLVLSIYTSELKKHKSNIHMANNYVLLARLH